MHRPLPRRQSAFAPFVTTPLAATLAIAAVAFALAACAARDATADPAHSGRFDVWIHGGTVIDGTGAPPRAADVGIRAGRIAAVVDRSAGAAAPGAAPAAASRIDATGLVVAPGFVDVHTHVDAEIARKPGCDNFARMGVTSIVTGNCGSSAEDLAAHFARVRKGGVGVNYGSLVGHGTVRRAVLGTANRAPTAAELAAMEERVAAGMRAGAFGLSTGLIYVPGTYARTDEIAALAAVAARHGGVYASHVRNEADEQDEALAEILRIGEAAGIPVHVSHVKCSGKPNWGRAAAVLRTLEAARARGVAVTADQYAYTASSTGIDVLFPAEALDVGREEFAEKLREDAAFRGAMRAALLRRMDAVGFGDFSYAQIASAKGNEDLNGLRIPEAAQKRLGRSDRDAQADLAMDLFAAAAPSRVGMVYHSMAEADVAAFLAADWIAIASDAGVGGTSPQDRPHPRGAGNNARVLGRYVREERVLGLPLAVHKMTALPCRVFGIADRGRIAEGCHADVVLFDPATIADGATFAEPTLPPTGIERVLVNGVTVVDRGKVTGARPGHVLVGRGAAAAAAAATAEQDTR